jgi:mono/diheme cytochrome c family protein
MNRSIATRRHLSLALLVAAAASGFAACTPFDTDEDYFPSPFGSTEVVTAAKPPPPISGGTLAITGQTAVAADPDRDLVWIVNLKDRSVSQVALQENDEPGRVAVDAAGRAHVALRRGGDVVSIDIASKKVVDRRAVCAAPRGITFDQAKDLLHVACVDGTLVSLPAAGGEAVRTLRLDRDLRDIVVSGDKLLVSRFRAAELLTVEADGTVAAERQAPPQFAMFEQQFQPAVAWRTVQAPNGNVLMVHQRGMTTPVEIETPGGYGSGGCDGSIVHGTVTPLPGTGAPLSQGAMPAIPFTILPVDVAVSPNGDLAVASAGTDQVIVTHTNSIVAEAAQSDPEFGGMGTCLGSMTGNFVQGQPIAVAFDSGGTLIAQTREPATLAFVGTSLVINLGGESRKDTGHEMFHTNPGGFSPMACAGCHPEGRDDGLTWNFNPIGARRTQFVSGGILQTAPLHWDGDMGGLDAIMGEVFVKRMGGLAQGPRRIRAFGNWIDQLPSIPAAEPTDTEAVARGEALYNDATVGCASCHTGAALTNNKTVSVGTGKAFQVPTLRNLADRAPFMHDGCAKTLRDRFNPACGGGDQHGVTSHLTPAQLDDLVAYLETL